MIDNEFIKSIGSRCINIYKLTYLKNIKITSNSLKTYL